MMGRSFRPIYCSESGPVEGHPLISDLVMLPHLLTYLLISTRILCALSLTAETSRPVCSPALFCGACLNEALLLADFWMAATAYPRQRLQFNESIQPAWERAQRPSTARRSREKRPNPGSGVSLAVAGGSRQQREVPTRLHRRPQQFLRQPEVSVLAMMRLQLTVSRHTIRASRQRPFGCADLRPPQQRIREIPDDCLQ